MKSPNAADAVSNLVIAINGGNVDAAVACYEPEAILVPQPGTVARGTKELRNSLAGFIALKPTLTMEKQQVLGAGELALYVSRWTLRGTDPKGQEVRMNGSSSDILRRQPDGNWLIAVDNPWGTDLLS